MKIKKLLLILSSFSLVSSFATMGILTSCSKNDNNTSSDNTNNVVDDNNNNVNDDSTNDSDNNVNDDSSNDSDNDLNDDSSNDSDNDVNDDSSNDTNVDDNIVIMNDDIINNLINLINDKFVVTQLDDSAKNEIKNTIITYFQQLGIVVSNVNFLSQTIDNNIYYKLELILSGNNYKLSDDCNLATLNNNLLTINHNFETKILNISSSLDSISNIIQTQFNTINNYDQVDNVLNIIKNKLNEFFKTDYIISIQLINNSTSINNVSTTIEYKLQINFNNNYKVIVDDNIKTSYVLKNNILYTDYFYTNIDANYNNVAKLVNDNFNTLTIDDIKNDVNNHTMDQLNFLKVNIDYIQTLLQKITNNEIIYNFIVDNANIIANLINNIITQSIRKDLKTTSLFQVLFEDKNLKAIFNNKEAINGLINLIEYFIPNDAENIVSIIKTLQSLPINMMITTIQKLLANKLPANIISSLDDLKKLGLLSFVIEHDVDLLSLLPTNTILNDIIEILKLTNTETFKNTRIIDFIINLIKTNNGVNYLKSLLLNLFNTNEKSTIGQMLNTFIFNNTSLNKDTLSGFFYVFANPVDDNGNLIYYKDFLNSITVSSGFSTASYSDHFLTLNYSAIFKYGMNLNFLVTKIYDLFPNFTINLGSISLNKNFITKNIPKKISIIMGDYVKYTLDINDYVKYNIKQKLNLNCLSWQVIGHEKYDVNMKHSCEKWYRNTPKGAIAGVAKVLSKYVNGIFYHIWDSDLNYKPDNSVLDQYTLPAFDYNSKLNGSVKINSLSDSEKNTIKNDILNTVSDNWVSNSQYEWHAGVEYVKLSQFYTTYNYDVSKIINKFVNFDGYNGEYTVKLNVYTLAKKLNVVGFSLPAIRMIQIKVFFPYFVNDGNGNFINHLTFDLF